MGSERKPDMRKCLKGKSIPNHSSQDLSRGGTGEASSVQAGIA